jgi:cell wall assembly regulator SMI1
MKDAVARLAAIASRYPSETAPRFETPSTPGELHELESATGLPLPAEVRDLLALHRSIVAMDIRNGYWIGGPTLLARSVRRGDYPAFIEGENGPVAAQPVATDGGGNAFLITSSGAIWRREHETGRTRRVAKSFVEFLHRVADDWEHHLAGDSAWSYLT